MRTSGIAASRCAASVAWIVPRLSFRESLARASGSIASNGGGRRSLASRPLALTDVSSQARRHGPALPAARAKPVMLAMVIEAL
jgi:hypothetical protein